MKIKLTLLITVAVFSAPMTVYASSTQRTINDGVVEFHDVKGYGTSEFECQYAHEECDEFEMEKDLKAQCALSGYINCDTTVRERVELETGDDYFFCGQWHKGQCTVSVRGSNDEASETVPESEPIETL